MAWNLGNTTVRNPTRIQEGLRVFAEEFDGNLSGAVQEAAFWDRLIETGVVRESAEPGSDWNGRKWRSCFVKIGLITDKSYTSINGNQITLDDLASSSIDLQGKEYELTPIGRRLVKAETQGAIEDIFLRQLVRLEVPSPTESSRERDSKVKPFILVLQVLKELSKAGHDPSLSKAEIAAFIQPITDHDNVKDIITRIVQHRKKRDAATGRAGKRSIDRQAVKDAAPSSGVKSGTLNDYADTTFRYCRLTGIFSIRGTRMLIQPEKLSLVDELLKSEPTFLTDQSPLAYLVDFYTGTKIPTDNESVALQQIKLYEQKINDLGHKPEALTNQLQNATAQQLTDERYRLEEQLRAIYEQNYASAHFTDISQIDDVLTYLNELKKSRRDPELAIDDPPSYLEWSVWRAFLAFNHLSTHPRETRRFRVDMDLRPVSHAPGGGADIIMQYSDFAIVIEVTLTTGSRQEAAEGESVRRHVTRHASQLNVPVYGVFVAPKIDLNTADVFLRGIYYEGEDKLDFDIVPLTMDHLIRILEFVKANLQSSRKTPEDIRALILNCLESRSQVDAPNWLKKIDRTVKDWAKLPAS